MKKKHAFFATGIFIIVLVSLSFTFLTCSANSERSLHSVVVSNLDAIKHIDPAALDMLKDQLAKGEQFGIDSREEAGGKQGDGPFASHSPWF